MTHTVAPRKGHCPWCGYRVSLAKIDEEMREIGPIPSGCRHAELDDRTYVCRLYSGGPAMTKPLFCRP